MVAGATSESDRPTTPYSVGRREPQLAAARAADASVLRRSGALEDRLHLGREPRHGFLVVRGGQSNRACEVAGVGVTTPDGRVPGAEPSSLLCGRVQTPPRTSGAASGSRFPVPGGSSSWSLSSQAGSPVSRCRSRPASRRSWRGGGSAADTSGAPVRVRLIQDSSDINVSSPTIERRGSTPMVRHRVNRPPPLCGRRRAAPRSEGMARTRGFLECRSPRCRTHESEDHLLRGGQPSLPRRSHGVDFFGLLSE